MLDEGPPPDPGIETIDRFSNWSLCLVLEVPPPQDIRVLETADDIQAFYKERHALKNLFLL